jgi:hypothetical protein
MADVGNEDNDENTLIIFTGPSSRGWHRLQQAAECLQKYAWTYGTGEGGAKGIVDKEAESKKPPLAKGELLHLALAQHYARIYQRQNNQNPDKYMHPHQAIEFMAGVRGSSQYLNLIRTVYDAYAEQYHRDEDELQIEGIERLFETHVRGTYLFTGRIDLMWRDRGGQLWACDHKTTSKLTSAHKEFYAASGQLIGYQHLVRKQYPELAGMKLNLVELSDRPRFERIVLPRSPLFEHEFEQTVVDTEESIARIQAQNRPLDRWPKAMNEMTCYGRYGACPFLTQCRWGAGQAVAGNWALAL